MKDYYRNKSRDKVLVTISAQDSPSNKNKFKKGKNKKHHIDMWDSTTPAIRVNAAKVRDKKQKNKEKKNISKITCYNCNRMVDYVDQCLELQKS